MSSQNSTFLIQLHINDELVLYPFYNIRDNNSLQNRIMSNILEEYKLFYCASHEH